METDPLTPLPAEEAPVKPGVVLSYATPKAYAVPDGWTTIDVFRLRPEARGRFLAIMVAITVGTSVAMVAAMAGITLATERIESVCDFDMHFVVFMGGFAAIMSVLGAWKIHRQWQSYRLVIAREGLVQTCCSQKTSIVAREEVQRIIETYDTWRVHFGHNYVCIAKRAERPERIRELLGEWMTIEVGPSAAETMTTTCMVIVASAAVFGTTIVGQLSDNLCVVSFCTAVAMLLSLWLTIRVWGDLTIRRWIKLMNLVYIGQALMVLSRLIWLLFIRFAA